MQGEYTNQISPPSLQTAAADPSSPGLDPIHRVRAMLAARGIRQREIAQRHGFQESLVSMVLRGHRKTLSVRRAIAEELGMDYAVVWSESPSR